VCTGSHTLTQADLDAREVVNTATADSNQTPPTRDTFRVPLAPATSALSLVKRAAETSFDRAGAVLHYTYVVAHVGGVSLAGPVRGTDARATGDCPPLTTVGNGDERLDPGEEVTCTATYSVRQADLDAGAVTNTATAMVDGTTSDSSSATVGATRTRSL